MDRSGGHWKCIPPNHVLIFFFEWVLGHGDAEGLDEAGKPGLVTFTEGAICMSENRSS